jgi:predicted dehydrogenase
LSTEKLRVGIIGIGSIALMTHIPKLLGTGKVELVAACRRDAAKLSVIQKALGIPVVYTDWREMLEKSPLDAVVVATPHHVRVEPTLESLRRGLHVLVEKPMALTHQDAMVMADAAGQAGRVLMVGYGSRFAGIWRTAKHRIASGELGTIRQINVAVNFYRRWIWESDSMPDDVAALGRKVMQALGLPPDFGDGWGHDWHQDPKQAGGGGFANNGNHTVDLALWLAGAPPVDVVAFTENAGLPGRWHSPKRRIAQP